MRILLVAEWIEVPGFGGGSVHYAEFSQALAGLGHEVHMLCKTRKKRLGHVFLHAAPRISFRPLLSIASQPLIEKICREHRIQVIHKRMDPGASNSPNVAKKLGIPLIAEVNYNPFAFERTGGFYSDFVRPHVQFFFRKIWAKRVLEQVALITCVSRSIKERLEVHGIHNQIKVIPNGANVRLFNPRISGSAVRRKYGRPLAILVGELGPRHGLEAVMQAARRLPHVKFLVIGGIEKYAEHVARMKKTVPENVVFAGRVKYEEMPKYLVAADVALAPFEESITEPFGFCPIKILDYFAAGRAVVASDLPWIRELVTDGQNGLLFKDKEQLVKAIERIIVDKKLRAKLEKNARKKAEELSWTNIAKKYVKLYSALAGRGR